MAHFAGQYFIAFFGVFSAGYIEKDAEYRPPDDSHILPLAACRNPSNFIADHDAEVCFVTTEHGKRRLESQAYTIAICGMNVGRELFERDGIAPGQAPRFQTTLV
ncbi:hypothetical protein WSK_0247 [Novosphingobium sp. Rr 2-17]|nr:hypothetical protein WSK_0247 [Novosphingobium sp. Rr 2-17]